MDISNQERIFKSTNPYANNQELIDLDLNANSEHYLCMRVGGGGLLGRRDPDLWKIEVTSYYSHLQHD